MKYVVRFVMEEIASALKKAGIARGKDNVLSVQIYGKKKKEIEADGVKAIKFWTAIVAVGPTLQATCGVYAEVKCVSDDSSTQEDVPDKNVVFHVPGTFRDCVEALSVGNDSVICVFDEKEVRLSGGNGANTVKLPAAQKPTFFSKLNGERVVVSVPAKDFLNGVKICAAALYSPSKEGFGASIGVVPTAGTDGAMLSMLSTDMVNVAGMDFKCSGITGDDAEAYREKAKNLPYFMLDSGKLSAICSSGNAQKVTLFFLYKEDEGVKVPQRVDIYLGDSVFQMGCGAKCYTAAMKNVMNFTSAGCVFTCLRKTLETACNLEAVGKTMSANPPILLNVSEKGVMVEGEQSRSRLYGCEVEKAAAEDGGTTEIYVGIPVLLNALKVSGEKAKISISDRGLILVQPEDTRAKFCTTQKTREKAEAPEAEPDMEE